MNGEILQIGMKKKGATRVLTLSGELDSYTCERLRSISETWIPGAKRVVVNLDKLEYVDSSGLAALVRMWVTARDFGVRMVFECRSRRINQILEITGLSGLFDVTGAKAAPGAGAKSPDRRADTPVSVTQAAPAAASAPSRRIEAGAPGRVRNPTSKPA